MNRIAPIALWVCSCHAYDQAYLDCMSGERCVDAPADAGSPSRDGGGLAFDDASTVDLGETTVDVQTSMVSRHLINTRAVAVDYVLAHDPHLILNFYGVDGGPACTETQIPADSVCRWAISVLPDMPGMFNGTLYLDSDGGTLTLNVLALVY